MTPKNKHASSSVYWFLVFTLRMQKNHAQVKHQKRHIIIIIHLNSLSFFPNGIAREDDTGTSRSNRQEWI